MRCVRLGAAVAALALGLACGSPATPAAGPPVTEPPPTASGRADPNPTAPSSASVLDPAPAGMVTTTAGGTTVTLRITPEEQYAGERFETAVEVSGPTAIRSVRLDLGDGVLMAADPAPAWACPSGSREVLAALLPVGYPVPGRYTVTAMVTVVPCVFLPGPRDAPMPWVASGPEQVLQARVDVHHRPGPSPQP